MRHPLLFSDDILSRAWAGVWEHVAVTVTIAVILIIFGLLWHRILNMINRLFMNIHVQGTWDTSLVKGEGKGYEPHETATLKQFMYRVWGKTKTTSGQTYRIQGRICGEKLCMVYDKSDKVGFDSGAMLLKISPGGKLMEGHEVGIDLSSGEPYSREYKWEKPPRA